MRRHTGEDAGGEELVLGQMGASLSSITSWRGQRHRCLGGQPHPKSPEALEEASSHRHHATVFL